MILLSQASPRCGDNDVIAQTAAARARGCTVYSLPEHLRDHPELWATAVDHVPPYDAPQPALWIGFVPTPALYERVFEAMGGRNLHLVNRPEHHLLSMELDRAFPRISDLTPQTLAVRSLKEVPEALESLGLPVFIKGAMGSLKERGWRACVAETVEEALALVEQLLPLSMHSRGRVLLRTLAPLRHHYVEATDFKIGREYRVFVLHGEIVGLGYYWPFFHEFAELSSQEEEHVRALARTCAARLEVPYLSVDIGQLEDRSWIVIETGDPQFSGLSFIPVEPLWDALLAGGVFK